MTILLARGTLRGLMKMSGARRELIIELRRLGSRYDVAAGELGYSVVMTSAVPDGEAFVLEEDLIYAQSEWGVWLALGFLVSEDIGLETSLGIACDVASAMCVKSGLFLLHVQSA